MVNVLCWLAGFIASIWIADYFYTSGDTVLGYLGIAIAGVCLVVMIFAIKDDFWVLFGNRGRRDDL